MLSSGIDSKFMPQIPLSNVNGMKMADKIVSKLSLLFNVSSLCAIILSLSYVMM